MQQTVELQTMELLTYPLTHNPIKVALLMAYLKANPTTTSPKIELSTRTIQLDKLEHHSEEFTAINPNKKVPALIDGDAVQWESNAILHHLAQRFESDLWPGNPAEQSQVIRWLMWESSRWGHTIGSLLKQAIYFPFWGYEGNADLIAKHSQKLNKLLDVLDQELQRHPYLAGSSLTIADLSIAAPLIDAKDLTLNLNQHSAVKLWLNDLSQSQWWQACEQELNHFRQSATTA